MKRLLVGLWGTMIWACLVSASFGQVQIIPPMENIEAGRSYLLSVTGLTQADLPKTIVIAEPKETTSCVGVTGWAGEQFLWFTAKDDGRRFIAVVIGQDEGKPSVASIALDVGPPPPPPVPPVPPPPPGDLTIVVVEESGDRIPSVANTLTGLQNYCKSKKVPCKVYDDDPVDNATGQVPKWWPPLKEAVTGKSLPVLLVTTVDSDGGYSVVSADTLPPTAREAINVIDDYIQEPDSSSLFVPTPMDVVTRMLQQADIKKSDVVCDLGSGDGRIPITAARIFGCKAVGIEKEVNLIKESIRSSEIAGVSDRVAFLQKDIAEVPLKNFDVATMYLSEEHSKELVPKLLAMNKGSRIVTHNHPLPEILADKTVSVTSEEDNQQHKIYLYELPLAKTRCEGPSHKTGGCSCLMCLGNHLISSHRADRNRLDSIGYRSWKTLHDNYHNKSTCLASGG